MVKAQLSAVPRRGHLFAWMALAWMIQGCGFYQPVEVAGIRGFDQVRWADGKLRGTFWVRLYNPNPYALHVTDSEVGLFLDAASIGLCTLESPVRVPGDAAADVAMRLETESGVLGTVLKSGLKRLLGGADAANVLHAEGAVTGRRWLFEHEVAIDFTDTLTLR